MPVEDSSKAPTLQHIKRVSRIKHAILESYLPPWATILGSQNRCLNYFDCFAGPGRYEFNGQPEDGSPVIAVKAAKEFLAARPEHTINIFLTEKNQSRIQQLEEHLRPLQPYPQKLSVKLLREDSNTFIRDLLSNSLSIAPSFFMIDPYGHPLPISVINKILSRQKTEALITLMWYRINMDLGNPAVQENVDRLFGNSEWRKQFFMGETGIVREDHFLEYFISKLSAKHVLPFRIRYDAEDKQGDGTKYYLLHVSNHLKAALLMKGVMWPLGDEGGTFDFSGKSQGVLISRTPKVGELKEILLREFTGKTVAFDQIIENTLRLPFLEKHYREAVLALEKDGRLEITRVTSKRSGLKEKDSVKFPQTGSSTNTSTDIWRTP